MKRLVVCCDGTWNELSRYPTNVVKLAQAVEPCDATGIAQVVYYQPGLGTQWYDRIPGGAFGWGIDYNIKAAYEFLCFNYEPGDEIYLFGFSRGAYTARSLAGMMYCSGLLQREHGGKIDAAYDLYRNRTVKPGHDAAKAFRSQFGVCVDGEHQIPITLLGCWDTVGSLGIPNILPLLPFSDLINRRYRFHDHQLNRKIQVALHAVAINERRKVFDVTRMFKSPKNPDQIVRQMWFPGVHGCVGGGTEKHQGLSDNALRWMMDSVADVQLGLAFNLPKASLVLDPTLAFDQSTGLFGLAGLHDRPIPPDPTVLHPSVQQRWLQVPTYRPPNLQRFAAYLNRVKLPPLLPLSDSRRAA
jgi:uncharacterized protein (DUF2235 family)